ncbi:MAG: pyruvate kinase, partial [Planctomycetaceae bacterium]
MTELPGGVAICALGEEFTFARAPDPSNRRVWNCTYEQLIDDLRVGDRVLLADGSVGLRVVRKAADNNSLTCEVEQPGEVRSRQGVNLPGAVLSTPSLTDKDRVDLQWALKHELDFVSLSFVRSADDLRQLRQEIARLSPTSTPQ